MIEPSVEFCLPYLVAFGAGLATATATSTTRLGTLAGDVAALAATVTGLGLLRTLRAIAACDMSVEVVLDDHDFATTHSYGPRLIENNVWSAWIFFFVVIVINSPPQL